MAVEPLRHMSIFSPDRFGHRRVDVIGAGATGSRIAMSLAKLGLTSLHVWDFDTVEAHNVANQLFGNDQLGKKKVVALAELVEKATGTKVVIHDEKADGSQPFGEAVFLLVDSMAGRKEIWSRGLKFKPQTKLLVETRMGADSGRVYTLNPAKLVHVKAYEQTLYADEETETSACGASISIGPTAEIVSGLAVWQFIRWFSIEQGKEDALENELVFSLRPMSTIITRSF